MWALVGVIVGVLGAKAVPISLHNSMDKCFEAREAYLAQLPKPKINYEVVCVSTDLNGKET